MSKSLYKLKEMLCDEIDSIAEKGELTPGSLATVDQLTHSLKSIETIMAMDEGGGYSNGYPLMHYGDRYGRYSRDGERDRVVDRLRSMLNEVSGEKDRSAIRKCISDMEG